MCCTGLVAPLLEPVSPALAGGFFTTAPPGKPREGFLKRGEELEREKKGEKELWRYKEEEVEKHRERETQKERQRASEVRGV